MSKPATLRKTATFHSDRFRTDIEYDPNDPTRITMTDFNEESMTYWGIDPDGWCFFITMIDGTFIDDLTEEA